MPGAVADPCCWMGGWVVVEGGSCGCGAHARKHMLRCAKRQRRCPPWTVAPHCCCCCSVTVLSETQEHALLVTAVGVTDSAVEGNRLVRVPGSNASAEAVLKAPGDYFSWKSSSKDSAPADWQALAASAGAWHPPPFPTAAASARVHTCSMCARARGRADTPGKDDTPLPPVLSNPLFPCPQVSRTCQLCRSKWPTRSWAC